MVNFHDPATLLQDYVDYVHFAHFLHGIYIWEFFTTLKFEWEFLTRKRDFKWTLVLYSTARILALGSVISNLIELNTNHSINCQLWIVLDLIIVYASFACGSVLMAIRVIMIWNRNLIVTILTAGMTLTNIGFLIHGVATVYASWAAVVLTCTLKNADQSRANITTTMATDIGQLILMIIGLWRCRQTEKDIVKFLYDQGLIWLVVATVAQIPTTVFIYLNLNDVWDVMFQLFSFYAMIICSTRMYRGLLNSDMEIQHNPSESRAVVSALQFRERSRKGTATATTTSALQSTHFNATYTYPEEVEFNVTEKKAADGDEEAQKPRVTSLTFPPHAGQSIRE
ncbi:hypothetical protein F5148DRAFT_1230294 [Russula earlei]|uniref:Uncharacterized protein n=1 Tax=Russula earlei TaxID=71964 RepID=A0ACC0TZ38_9AGAM|nr:hypothetical protein F5148DRAFT_1230294 [Russula earlei]